MVLMRQKQANGADWWGIGDVFKHTTVLEILDDRVGKKFNKLRHDCLEELNKVLHEAGIDVVNSELVNK